MSERRRQVGDRSFDLGKPPPIAGIEDCEVLLVDLAGRALFLEILDRLPEELPLVRQRFGARPAGSVPGAPPGDHTPEAHRDTSRRLRLHK